MKISKSTLKIILGIGITVVVIAILFIVLRPKQKSVAVIGTSWEYTINIEKYKQVTESSWYLPSEAELLYTRCEIRRYERRISYYRTTAHRNEPVYKSVPIYDTKFYYKIWRWVHEREVVTKAKDKNPYYGDPNLANDEREGGRTEVYKIRGVVDGKEDKAKWYKIDKTHWQDVNIDNMIICKIAVTGKITEVLSIK